MSLNKRIYDEICRILTDYECNELPCAEEELYSLLVKIQNNWEDIWGEASVYQ